MKIVQQWSQQDADFIRKKVIDHNMEQLPDNLKTPNENTSFVLMDENNKNRRRNCG